MPVTLSRKQSLALLVGVILIASGILLNACQSSAAATASALSVAKSNETSDLTQVARQVATAFGQGHLYQSPNAYPLTPALQASIAKLPNRARTWPEFVGLTGDAVVVLHGQDTDHQSFTDVVVHVLNRGTNQSLQLTQIDLRLIEIDGAWHVDRLLTLAKGAIQP